MFIHDGKITLSGGAYKFIEEDYKKCHQLVNGKWKEHSVLNSGRNHAMAVSTNTGTYLFGGSKWENRCTYEYLPKTSNIWQDGKTHIPQGFGIDEIGYTTAVPVKPNEIWFINGGNVDEGSDGYQKMHKTKCLRCKGFTLGCCRSDEYRVCEKKSVNKGSVYFFNPETHTFTLLPIKLSSKRSGHRCALIPGSNKLIVTGGLMDGMAKTDTEIINIDNFTVTSGTPLNIERAYHGIGIIIIDNKVRLAVFGGCDENDEKLDSVEIYSAVNDKWEMTNIKLNQKRDSFGFLSLSNSELLRNF